MGYMDWISWRSLDGVRIYQLNAMMIERASRHLHLHVLSSDLLSEKMKNKKHYNSFHPKLGFFLDIQEVLEWFDAEPMFYSNTVS